MSEEESGNINNLKSKLIDLQLENQRLKTLVDVDRSDPNCNDEIAFLEKINFNSPLLTVVIDKNLDVVRVNEVAINHDMVDLHRHLISRFGNIIGCVNSLNSEKGCGHSSQCETCAARRLFNDAIEGRKNIRNKLIVLEIRENEELQKKYFDVTILFLNKNDEQFWVIYANDVSTQHALLNDLKEINASKDLFFSIISHDLRTPFNAIHGFNELVIENIKEKDFHEALTNASYVNEASLKSLNLISNLLEWSRNQRGIIAFDPETFSVHDFIYSVKNVLENSFEVKGISIKIELEYDFAVLADKNMLSVILRNLLTNAIKYSNRGKTVFVGAIKKESYAEFYVQDEGVGISSRGLNKLFDLGQKYSTRGTDDEGGTGLGLVLCNDFVKKHGGKMEVKSEVGLGSRFSFTIPLDKR